MSTVINAKDTIDKGQWRPLALKTTACATGQCLACDLRNNQYKDPFIWNLASTTALEKYKKGNMCDDWLSPTAFTALGGAIGAGSGSLYVPSHGPTGNCNATGATTTTFTLAALPFSASVGINQLANAGDGLGFRIRVNFKTAATGKVEERTITANTAGTTPLITVDTAFSYTPTATDTYEIISGRVYLLGSGTTAAGYWKAYDVATGTISGNLSTTNLSATIGTDFNATSLDERYVPYNMSPGDGMVLGGATYSTSSICIQGTAAGASSITGSGMPSALVADEFKNYQVRVVEDTTNVTAVGQRRLISTHTGGATGAFTLKTAWSVTPSSSAKFVVENNNDLLLWTNAATVTYSYAASGYAADASWSTAAASGGAMQYANPPAAMGAGSMSASKFSLDCSTQKNVRNSQIHWFRGSATSTAYTLDISNGANGTWSSALVYGNQGQTFTSGSCCNLDAATNSGKYLYISVNGTQRVYRFDLLNNYLEPWVYLSYSQGTGGVGGRMAGATYIDGNTKVATQYLLRSSGAEFFDAHVLG